MKYIILLTICTLVSCSKNSDIANKPLLAGKYKSTSLRYGPLIDYDLNGSFESECIDLIKACQKDDIIEFTTDKRGLEDNGLNLCAPTLEVRIDNFSWWLINNNRGLDIELDRYPEYRDTVEIEILSDSVFRLKHYEDKGSIENYYTILETFTKIK